jgi:hypothetical protein
MVRVRGWVERDPLNANAPPMIEVTRPEQIEFLNPITGEVIERTKP